MKTYTLIFALVLFFTSVKSQELEVFYLNQSVSKSDTITYKRIIEFNKTRGLYHVQDYYPSGQIQMKGTYSSFDKNVKENYWCNYRGNTKQGVYETWHKNGQIESRSNFVDGKFHGLKKEWYRNGQLSQRSEWIKGNVIGNGMGQMHGSCITWSKEGKLQCNMILDKGLKQNPIDTNYHYISYTPKKYEKDTLKKWPLLIYLHGGSDRGTDTIKLYASGIPDQIWRGREFPFVIVAPQCPLQHRWSTDNWFENFYDEITKKYEIDTNRVYLTGLSLGGAGTWYLAMKYPEKIAAIAPMSGFTSHVDYIYKNVDKLKDMPVWAFHGVEDKVAQVEETDRMYARLKEKNPHFKYTRMPKVGHSIHWLVYPEQDLYDWFLEFDKSKENKN